MASPQQPAPQGSPRAVFGSLLRFVRERAGLSQQELVGLVHMSLSTSSSYETGRRVPPRDAVTALEAIPALDARGVLLKLVCWDTLRSEALSRSGSLALLEEVAKSWTSAT